jgi:3-hydroxy acid dehydrogenase/malonic semialdehyde reductase
MNKVSLITGASSGIGKATAFRLAAENYNLILTGRRRSLLEQLKADIISKFSIDVLILEMDIRKTEETIDIIRQLDDDWKNIDLLINNAGLAAGLDLFNDASFSDWNDMIDTNIRGLLAVSQQVSKIMVQRHRGHIINIGSIAGTQAYERGNIYCATKHAVEAISECMRIDLLKHRIRVTLIRPGAVETAFSLVRFKGNEEKAAQVYQGYEPLTAENIAEAIVYAAMQPENININSIELTPIAQANAYYFNKNYN